jgi:hypothetical protein
MLIKIKTRKTRYLFKPEKASNEKVKKKKSLIYTCSFGMSECIFDRKKENLFCCQQKSKLSRAENCIQAKMYV